MMYGLNQETIESLNEIFSKHNKISKVVLYGSRAKGNYKNGSDIDLTLFGDDINLKLLHKIELEIDNLLLPYKVDLSIYNDMNNEDLKEHISRVGIIFYKINLNKDKK